jgi:hypothetical protein
MHERLDAIVSILTNKRHGVGAAERLQRRTRERLVSHQLHALRLIRGGSGVNDDRVHDEAPTPDKAALVTKLLLETPPLCVACLSTKSGVPVGEIEPVVSRLERTIFVKRDMGPCRTCGRWTLVYSLFGKP